MQVIPLWGNFLSSMFNYPLKFFFSSTTGFSSPSKSSKFAFVLNNLSFKRGYDHQSEDEEAEFEPAPPSPSLVQVPVQYLAVGSIKEKLPVMEYGCGKEDGGGDSTCAVCLKCMSEGDEVRELGNCSHVFHKECLDGWIDQGQLTCPLCRSKLLPSDDQDEGEVLKCGGDPWRRERMIYLFGEDFVFQ